MDSGTWIAIAGGYAMQNGLLKGNINMIGLITAAIIVTIMFIFAIFVKTDKSNKKDE